jgi:hypothetical protein
MGKCFGLCKGWPQSEGWMILWMMHVEYAGSEWVVCSLKCLNLTESVNSKIIA